MRTCSSYCGSQPPTPSYILTVSFGELLQKAPTMEDNNSVSAGRKGDCRMHRAVAARLANHRLSLYDALLIGGFDYPFDDANTLDNENVLLSQRKNQLSRRLRTARRQSDPSPASIINLDGKQLLHPQQDLFVDALISSSESSADLYKTERIREAPASVPSSVAILSLSKTAATVGMTLDQLAQVLSTKNTLSKVLSPEMDKKELAMNYYMAEVKSLYTKAMLVAGFPPEIAHNPRSIEYQQFAGEAWKREGQRLLDIMNSSKPAAAPVPVPLSHHEQVFEPIRVVTRNTSCQRLQEWGS